jgi:hypothetical protein
MSEPGQQLEIVETKRQEGLTPVERDRIQLRQLDMLERIACGVWVLAVPVLLGFLWAVYMIWFASQARVYP